MMGASLPAPTPPAPTVPTSPLARYRATDLAGTHSDGDPVASWPDATGNGHDAVQATVADQPTFRAAVVPINGNPAVDFENVGTRRLISPAFASPLAVTTWAGLVFFQSLFASNRVFFDGSTGRHAVFYDATTEYAYFAGTVVASATPATVDVHDVIAVFDGASSALYVDGVEIASGDPGAQSLDRVVLGAQADGTNPADIHMVEVLLYDRALDAAERTQLRTYLNDTYL